MKPVIVSHPDYRRFLSGVGGMYRINWRSYPPAVREIYIRFRELDLSAVDRIMQDQYSDKEAYGLLFRIFRTCFLDESIRRGKVNPARLNIAGDGTPVVTAARFRSHHTSPPRESDEWKLMYNKRTSSERCNKRIKLDYLLEAGKHHSTKFWYVRLYLIMMLIHMTSWNLPE